jgi:hypothetical protein
MGHFPAGQSWNVILVFKSKKHPHGLKVTPSKVTGVANGFNLLSGVPQVRVVELYTGHSRQIAIRIFAISKILFISQ